jgi:hypothetical protein
MDTGFIAVLLQAVQTQPPDVGVEAGKIMLALTGALGMAVVVERVIEFGKNILDLKETRPLGALDFKPEDLDAEFDDLNQRIDKREAVLRAQARLNSVDEKLKVAPANKRGQLQIERESAANELTVAIKMAEEAEGEFDEGAPIDTILVHDASDPDVRITGRTLGLQLATFAVGIIGAHIAEIQLFNAFLSVLKHPINPSLDYVLTGLFIGGGSQPVHTLIRFITERKYTPAPDTVDDAEVSGPGAIEPVASATPVIVPATPAFLPSGGGVAVIAPPSAWAQIPYTGGVDVQKLQTTHRRSGPPEKIVYHHTAMHLKSKFEDVVRVIKNRESNGRKWLTGYNCVVTSDGGIHAFCRWDRYGNHAAGHNDRSLGISLNGNFETKEISKWSNYNGAYGPARPTDAQLHAAARVTSLWCVLYKITPDFDKTIIPHKNVSPKSCPGNEFPYAEFEHLVHEYYDRWMNSAEGKSAATAFALKPYLF